jgi:hypothetical protein
MSDKLKLQIHVYKKANRYICEVVNLTSKKDVKAYFDGDKKRAEDRGREMKDVLECELVIHRDKNGEIMDKDSGGKDPKNVKG